MLPSFPKIEKYSAERNKITIHKLVERISPMAGRIKKSIQFEGKTSAMHREDKSIDVTRTFVSSAEITIERRPFREIDQRYLLGKLAEIARQMAGGVDKGFFEEMDRVTSAVGNVVDVKGKPIDENAYLEAIEVMEQRFEKGGKWIPPLMVGGSALSRAMADMTRDPKRSRDFNDRLGKILEVKRDEFRRREANRILVG